jgi:hypothetical protein
MKSGPATYSPKHPSFLCQGSLLSATTLLWDTDQCLTLGALQGDSALCRADGDVVYRIH